MTSIAQRDIVKPLTWTMEYLLEDASMSSIVEIKLIGVNKLHN